MNKSLLSSLIATSFSLPPIYAQVPNPSIGNNAGSPTDSHSRSGAQHNSRQSTHGEEIPIIDPTNKVIKFQGQKYSLTDNNLGGQFEAFLATDTLSLKSAAEYRATIQQILNYLSPNKDTRPRLDLAFRLLSKASKYPGDGNICESLVNSLSSARNSKKNVSSLYKKALALEKEKKRIIHNMAVMESKLNIDTSDKSGSNKGQQSSRKSGIKSIEYTQYAKRLIEIEAIKKKLETEGLIDITQAKIQYQAMIVHLFIQRRFEHVVIASRFYNLVFADGDSKLRLKKGSDTEKFFTEGVGVNPTVAGMDAAASEAIRKVDTLVNAFNNNIRLNRVHAASERLVEAYAIGEFMPSVQTVPSEPKQRIQQYIQDANDMVKTLQARDLEKAERLNNELSKQASDYNESEAKSYINGLKTVSKNYVRDANLALFQLKYAKNTQERYNEEQRFKNAMAGATKSWPSNPDIEKLGAKIDNMISTTEKGLDKVSITRKDFDSWKKAEAWQAILSDQARLMGVFGASGLPEDNERLKQLELIIKNKYGVIRAVGRAKEAEEFGSPQQAWEEVHRMQKQFPDDIQLARAITKYSSPAAAFSTAIAKAQELEKEDSASFHALTWYLKAKTMNSRSKYVSEGISRILEAYKSE